MRVLSGVVYMTKSKGPIDSVIDGFALLADRVALKDDRSLAPQATDSGATLFVRYTFCV